MRVFTRSSLQEKVAAPVRRIRRMSRRQQAVLAGVVMIFAVLIAVITPNLPQVGGAAARDAQAAQAYKETLQGQVDTSRGEPQAGRDPSSQQQTSLAYAASSANGAGSRTDKPAAGVSGHNHTQTSYSDVYGDPQKTGINSAGCFVDYGIPGEQCVPAGLAGDDGLLTCAELRSQFADGVKLSGSDRFHLDHNRDGWACGTGE